MRRKHPTPTLPISLPIFAHRPLRATELFIEASVGTPKCDVPDLGVTAHPYHNLPQLLHSPLIHANDTTLLNMYHTLNGNQLRHLREMGQRRYEDASRPGGFKASTGRLLEELKDRIGQWELINAHEEPSREQEEMVYELCVEWGARVIFGMHEELEVRSRGWDIYHASYMAEELTWQNINVYR
jgi:hypothetical protein